MRMAYPARLVLPVIVAAAARAMRSAITAAAAADLTLTVHRSAYAAQGSSQVGLD